MKKLFTLFAVATLAFAAQANVLTVCEGDANCEYAPFYGFYMDTRNTVSQAIYPADMLTDMQGGKITEIKFYSMNPFTGLGNGNLQLSLKTVDQTGFTQTAIVAGATVVANGYPVDGESELVFILDEPFEYSGGNLLVETLLTQAGSFKTTKFHGVNTDYTATIAAYRYAWSDYYYEVESKLPQATFTYEAGDVPVDPTEKADAPNSTKENYIFNDGNTYYNAYTVTLTQPENSEDVNYEIYYRIGVMTDGEYVYGDWMLYTGEFSITDEGTYMVEAYATADGKLESDHIWDGFTVSKMVDVEEMFAGKTVAGVRYFNLAGQEMQQAEGMTIVVTTYTDGTTSAVKVIR